MKETVKIAPVWKGGMVQSVLGASSRAEYFMIDYDGDGSKDAISVPQENGTTAQALSHPLSSGWVAGDCVLAAHEELIETDEAASGKEPA